MTDYGAEILFETSRFWADRLEAMPDGRYALSRVVGPDEFHEHVDNSAYTNYLVRWHLQQAAHVYAVSRSATPANWPGWPNVSGSSPMRSNNGSPGPSRSVCPPETTTG
jgi:Trehalose and maltose hydrolases (possible phosphorylases)